MSRTPIDQLIPRADKHIVRAFPRVAQRLENSVDQMDRSEMDTFLKILPGAIERFTAVVTPQNDLHECVQVAISQLVDGFPKKSFEPQTVSTDDPASQFETSNTSIEVGESVDDVSGSELPNGSDTSQVGDVNTLAHNDLQTVPGSDGESDASQERPQNARVRTRQKLKGRALARQRVWGSGKTAGDQG